MMTEFFHQKWSDKEILATELPGELWVKLFDVENPQYLCEMAPEAATVSVPSDASPIISISKFMGVYNQKPNDMHCQCLMPYIRGAMDLGYDYLMLTK